MLIPFGILSSAGSLAEGDFELIATEILTASTPSVTFSSLATHASTYKHLQVRWVARTTASFGTIGVYSRLNGDSATNYAGHALVGTGSSVVSAAQVSTTFARSGVAADAGLGANAFGAGVVDLLDPYSTTKNKTFRTLSGNPGGNRIDLQSGLYINTASVTSWQLLPESGGGDFIAGSRFSLYGVRG